MWGSLMVRVALCLVIFSTAVVAEEPVGDAEWGGELYAQNCRSCHGMRGQNRALGRSRPLNTLLASEVLDHLLPYLLPHDGRGMQDRIKSSLSEQDISDLAAFIATLPE